MELDLHSGCVDFLFNLHFIVFVIVLVLILIVVFLGAGGIESELPCLIGDFNVIIKGTTEVVEVVHDFNGD